MTWRGALVVGWTIVGGATSVAAQNYRVRVDASAQAVSFRGLVRDSIDIALAVPGANGGLETADGYSVRCGASGYCLFLRPGPTLRAVPITTSASLVLWGLRVPGLAFHATARVIADAAGNNVWPGTSPSGQLLEGYFEYQYDALSARAGRQLVASRLEPIGFDGALVKYRWNRAALELTGYGGWGLGQATALSVLSPALNPLDEWRPRNRQIVSGMDAAWVYRALDARAEYRREIDPEDHYFVSERAALSMSARLGSLRATGGTEYNMAEGHAGSTDVSLMYGRPRYSVTGGVRHYQPYFSLWTLWGAFNPVPYDAVNASMQVRATHWLSLNGRTEWYRYGDAGISTALVNTLEDQGWRVGGGAKATVNARWSMEGTYSIEHGPGASGRFADASVTYAPNETWSLDGYGGTMARPLELRFYDATSRWIGGRMAWQRNTQQRLWTDVAMVDDNRERPDAGSKSLLQFRLRAGLSLAFGSRADRIPLPPARPTEK